MEDRNIQIQLGAGAIVASVFLIVVAIPVWVSSPSNVPNIILSPLFWPNVLAAITALIGAGMIVTSIARPGNVIRHCRCRPARRFQTSCNNGRDHGGLHAGHASCWAGLDRHGDFRCHRVPGEDHASAHRCGLRCPGAAVPVCFLCPCRRSSDPAR